MIIEALRLIELRKSSKWKWKLVLCIKVDKINAMPYQINDIRKKYAQCALSKFANSDLIWTQKIFHIESKK